MRHKPGVLGVVQTVVSVAVVALACASCGSSSAQPPNVFLTTTLGLDPNGGGTNACSYDETGNSYFAVGSSAGNPISTGESYMGSAPITVNCVVSQQSGGSYTVNLEVNEGALYTITLNGTVTSSGSTDISAGFSSNNGGSFNSPTSMPCMLTLSTAYPQPVQPGRIAGSVTCPELVDQDSSDNVCYGTAAFVFQNCGE
jgi:hypothetical protein